MAAELLVDGIAKTENNIRFFIIKEKPYTRKDGNGLFVLVHPNGSKYFQLRTTVNGKPKLIQIGVYGDISLAEAREKAKENRKAAKAGIDPVLKKKIDKANSKLQANATLKVVYESWLNEKTISPAYHKKITSTFKGNVLPKLGDIPIKDISAPLIKNALKVMEVRGSVTLAKKVKAWLKEIIDFATSEGLRYGDNPASVVKLNAKHEKVSYPTFKNRSDAGIFLRRLIEYGGRQETILGLQLLMLTAVRPSELRLAKWQEFDLNAGIWEIPKERMKMRKSHVVMLSKQALSAIKLLKQLSGYQDYILPDLIGQNPISNATFNMALQRIWNDYRIVSHGFRHFFSTHANESRLFHKDVIETALAHGDENKIRGTYNLAEYRGERAKLAQWWADELDVMRDGAKILVIKTA